MWPKTAQSALTGLCMSPELCEKVLFIFLLSASYPSHVIGEKRLLSACMSYCAEAERAAIKMSHTQRCYIGCYQNNIQSFVSLLSV